MAVFAATDNYNDYLTSSGISRERTFADMNSANKESTRVAYVRGVSVVVCLLDTLSYRKKLSKKYRYIISVMIKLTSVKISWRCFSCVMILSTGAQFAKTKTISAQKINGYIQIGWKLKSIVVNVTRRLYTRKRNKASALFFL